MYSNVDYKTFYCQPKVLIFIICLMFTVLLGYGHKTAGEVASRCEHCAQSDQSRPDFHTGSASLFKQLKLEASFQVVTHHQTQ